MESVQNFFFLGTYNVQSSLLILRLDNLTIDFFLPLLNFIFNHPQSHPGKTNICS